MLNILLRQRWMVVGLACFFGLFVVFVIDAHRKPTVVRYLEQKNIPANMEQLGVMYPEAPESENGIFLLFKAANNIKEPNRDEYERLPFAGGSEVEFGAPLTPEQRDALQHYVDSHKEVLATIYEALEYPYVRLTHYRYGIDYDFFSSLRTLSRFLSAVSIHAAIDNDTAQSFEATKANFAISEISIYGSDAISELIRIAILGLAVSSIEKAQSYATLTPSMIHAYMELLAIEENRGMECYQNALITDCALDFPAKRYHGRLFEDLHGQFNTPLLLVRVGREWNQFAFFSERIYIQKLEEILNMNNQGIYSMLASVSHIPKENTFSSSFRDSAEDTYCYLRQTHFDFYNAYCIPARSMANTAAARTALAALLYYYDHGNMPDTLDALAPTYLDVVPRDPFTPDQSIRFRVDGDSALFYSIGRSQTDNGGVYDYDNCKDCDDIVFRLKVPEGNIPLKITSTGNL